MAGASLGASGLMQGHATLTGALRGGTLSQYR
nr:MAG TPA_asm: hypothetical protein [Caudoviricetes sp.]